MLFMGWENLDVQRSWSLVWRANAACINTEIRKEVQVADPKWKMHHHHMHRERAVNEEFSLFAQRAQGTRKHDSTAKH